jgi:hypothetical protein
MESEPNGQETKPKLSNDQYLAELEHKPVQAQLDRSKVFRYEKDIPLLRAEAARAVQSEQPLNITLIGVGNMEEPYSYAAVLQDEGALAGAQLNMVDIRPKSKISPVVSLGKTYESPTGIKLGGAFLDPEQKSQMKPVPLAPKPNWPQNFEINQQTGEYEFNREARNFVDQSLSDPAKSHLETAVEDYTESPSLESASDVVSCNNVLQHIGGLTTYENPIRQHAAGKEPEIKDYSEFSRQATKVALLTKPGGLLMLHTDGSTSPVLEKYIPVLQTEFERVGESTYRRKLKKATTEPAPSDQIKELEAKDEIRKQGLLGRLREYINKS